MWGRTPSRDWAGWGCRWSPPWRGCSEIPIPYATEPRTATPGRGGSRSRGCPGPSPRMFRLGGRWSCSEQRKSSQGTATQLRAPLLCRCQDHRLPPRGLARFATPSAALSTMRSPHLPLRSRQPAPLSYRHPSGAGLHLSRLTGVLSLLDTRNWVQRRPRVYGMFVDESSWGNMQVLQTTGE